ncbi:MAG: hypothetical protein J6Q38_05245 [Clostridia bacterium]|nr:hypothetical protein [Clostridia bacterium]
MKKLIKITAWVVFVAILSAILFVPKEVKSNTNQAEYKTLLNVWQIDSFSGGTGSRASFLRRVSTSFSKKYIGVLSLVTVHSVESAKEAVKAGKFPDVVSIGISDIDFSSSQKEVGNLNVEGGGIINKKRYFVPWAKGGYFILKRGEGSKDVTVIEGKFNSALVALALSKTKVNSFAITDANLGFNDFILKKNATMIATQREVVRLKNRGVEFSYEAINEYCDLYQYALITSNTSKNEYYSRLFVDYLLSDNIQNKLTEILMLSTVKKGLYPTNEEYCALEKQSVKYTLSPFSSANKIEKIKSEAKEVLLDSKSLEGLIKLLKQL